MKGQRGARSKNRRPGWFELVGLFGEKHPMPLKDFRTFFCGKIKDYVVVQVPQNTPTEVLDGISKAAKKDLGIDVIVVHEGIEFFKFQPCSAALNRELDELSGEGNVVRKKVEDGNVRSGS